MELSTGGITPFMAWGARLLWRILTCVLYSHDTHYQQILQHLAGNARRRRKELGLTQEAAAQAMQMATRHLQKLEAGELNVTLRTLTRVAHVLQVEIEELITAQPNVK